MNKILKHLLLADDDDDDCIFFKEALEELPVSTSLVTVNDGEQLMHFLYEKSNELPDALFLDLNMPRKSGFECLSEIKLCDKLKKLPVIVFSTSFDLDIVNTLYNKGAHYYIRKPGDYNQLKNVIFKALTIKFPDLLKQPSRDNFIIEP